MVRGARLGVYSRKSESGHHMHDLSEIMVGLESRFPFCNAFRKPGGTLQLAPQKDFFNGQTY